MRIYHNIPALYAYNALSKTNSALQKSIQTLSSGLRINSAADDAAGLAISEKMRSQIKGLNVAIRNAQDGVSMLQTAEGAINETHSILQRMRELAVQAANDTLTQQDRQYIQLEIDQLKEEVSRIATATQFNKKRLLDGSSAALWSSNDLSTKAYVRGSLRQVDQFGQKAAFEGNFKIMVNATPGQAEALKTDIFTIKHKNVVMNASINSQAGVSAVRVDNLPAGNYRVNMDGPSDSSAFSLDSSRSVTAKYLAENLKLDLGNYSSDAGTNLTAEVDSISASQVTIKLSGTVGSNAVSGNLVFNMADGSLDTTPASSTAIATLNGLGITLGGTKFNGPIDVNRLSQGTSVGFDVSSGGTFALTGGPAASNVQGPGNWAGFDIGANGSDPKTDADLRALLDVMRAEGVSAYTIETTVTATDAAAADFTLTIGGQTFTGSGAASANGTVTLTNASTGAQLNIRVTQPTVATGINTGSTWSKTYTLGSTAGAATISPALSVNDYKAGVIFEPDASTPIPGNHDIVLKVNSVNTVAGTVTFDVFVDGVAGSTPTITLGATAAGTPFSLTIAGQTVNFSTARLDGLDLSKVRPGDTIYYSTAPKSSTAQVGYYGSLPESDWNDGDNGVVFRADDDTDVNASVLLEVTAVDTTSGAVTFRATSSVLKKDGTVQNYVENNIVFHLNDLEQSGSSIDLGFGFTYGLGKNISLDDVKKIRVGNKVVYNVTAKADPAMPSTADTVVTIDGDQNAEWDYNWITPTENGVTKRPLHYALQSADVKGKEVHFRNFYLNSYNGTYYEGDVVLTLTENFRKPISGVSLSSFEAAYVGQTAKSDVQLRDIDKFWNPQGVFMLNDPQTITISQGNGKNTSVTLYSTDTLSELRKKLNDAIATGLEQGQYATTGASQFVTFVEDPVPNTLESVAGTFIIRSMVAGNDGKLTFAGDEDLINALSLNVVQAAKENSFSVSVYDAHNASIIASDVKVSGNLLVGVIHPNVDVEFDPMANIKAVWNDASRGFLLTKEPKPYETTLHLVDNSTVYQVGANEGDDVTVDIGNMSAEALGINRVIVTDHTSAGRAITILDSAISKVSSQRARIGAYENSLEHTVTNLRTTSTNLTEAESRIRDADMSEEMLNFTRLQILSQSGTAMLAQANQLPQSILSLIRG